MTGSLRVSTFFCACVGLLAVAAAIHAQDEAPAKAQLTLTNEDAYAGDLLDCDLPNVLRWKTSLSDEPFDFPLTSVNSLHQDRFQTPEKIQGEAYLQLAGGGFLLGKLKSVTKDLARIDTPHLGELEVPVGQVTRIFLGNRNNGLIYVGPRGLSEWKGQGQPDVWQREAGRLVASGNASIQQEFELPSQICFEVVLGLKNDCRFAFTVGKLFSLEKVEKNLVLIRETDDKADIALVTRLEDRSHTLHLQVFVDQSLGEVHLFSIDGKELANVSLKAEENVGKSTLRIHNHRGTLSLERLLIRGWHGILPGKFSADETIVQMADGENRKVDQVEIEEDKIVLNPGQDDQQELATDKVIGITYQRETPVTPTTLRVALPDGTQLAGNLQRVQDGKLHLRSPSVVSDVGIPINEIDSLITIADEPAAISTEAHQCILKTLDVYSRGLLVDHPADAPPGSLYWKPLASKNFVRLRPDVSGTIEVNIVEEEVAATVEAVKQASSRAVNMIAAMAVQGRVSGGFPRSQQEPEEEDNGSQQVIILRGGDRFLGHVTSIDEKTVRFTSEFVEVTSLPQEEVKVWESSGNTKFDDLEEQKRNRLLMLPRLQRKSPPTHMVESKNGDFLRGRLVSMDENKLVLEVRLEDRQIDRDLVRRIVWLESSETKPAPTNHDGVVQAVNRDGLRLSFTPTILADGVIDGTSELLGPCHVKLSQVKQLLLGSAIEDSAESIPENKWALTDAPDPLFVNEDGSPSGASDGSQSPMVGNDAPDFTLDLLAGDKFQLSEQHGKVIVLDFWASWCGPCVRAMPQIDAVVKEFEGQPVRLIGVNQQEDRATVKSMLERLEITPEIVLDIDGAASEKYNVTAIPQTVVIDPAGKVAAVFVGGGPQLADQLRDAIKRAGEPKKED